MSVLLSQGAVILGPLVTDIRRDGVPPPDGVPVYQAVSEQPAGLL